MAQIRRIVSLDRIISQPIVIAPKMYRAFMFILVILGLGMLAAAMYKAPEMATQGLVLLGLGPAIVLLFWHWPEIGLLALVFLTSSFIPSDIVDVRLPVGGGLDLSDLVLIGLFGIVCLRELTSGTMKVPWWPVGGLLLLFLILAVFSAYYALAFQHVESNWALGDLRILILYATFFITLWSIKRSRQLKILLIGLFIIADLSTIIVSFQQYLGSGNLLLQAMTTSRNWRVYQQAGGLRVIPASQVLMHFMWFVALGILLLGRPKRSFRVFCVAQLLVIGVGHVLSYTRSQWLALILGLGLFFAILAPRYKQHLAKAAFLASCVAVVAGVIVGGTLSNSSVTPFVAGVVERFGSLFVPSETSETGSLQWRAFETEKALQAISKQPLTGVGLGNRYRSLTTFMGEADGWWTRGSIAAGEVSRFTRYVHNSYLSIAVKMGIPGLLVLLWFCTAVLFKGFQIYRSMLDSEYKGVVLGILVSFVGLLVWCFFHAHLIKAESTGVIALMTGIIGSQVYKNNFGMDFFSGRKFTQGRPDMRDIL